MSLVLKILKWSILEYIIQKFWLLLKLQKLFNGSSAERYNRFLTPAWEGLRVVGSVDGPSEDLEAEKEILLQMW